MAHVALARVPIMFCGFAALVAFTTEAQPHIRVRSLQKEARPIPIDSELRKRLLATLQVPLVEHVSYHMRLTENFAVISDSRSMRRQT